MAHQLRFEKTRVPAEVLEVCEFDPKAPGVGLLWVICYFVVATPVTI